MLVKVERLHRNAATGTLLTNSGEAEWINTDYVVRVCQPSADIDRGNYTRIFLSTSGDGGAHAELIVVKGALEDVVETLRGLR